MGNSWTSALPYFARDELACRHCGVILLDRRFAARLPALREKWGDPLNPTSVCRCPTQNKNEKGHPRSMHLTYNPVHETNGTMAADIFWANWDQGSQLRFAKLAYRMGFSVGLNVVFCHIDLRVVLNHLSRACFLYDNWDDRFSIEEVMSNAD